MGHGLLVWRSTTKASWPPNVPHFGTSLRLAGLGAEGHGQVLLGKQAVREGGSALLKPERLQAEPVALL